MITVRTKKYTQLDIEHLRKILSDGINTELCSLYDGCDTCTNRILCKDIENVIDHLDITKAGIKHHRKSK